MPPRSRSVSPVRFVLLEDNWEQAALIEQFLKDQFPGSAVQIVKTVKQFNSYFETVQANPPDVIILDMMVPFTDPLGIDNITGGEDEDYFRAGSRCFEALRKRGLDGRTIIYSVIDKEDLYQANLAHLADIHVQKEEDKTELLNAIRRLL